MKALNAIVLGWIIVIALSAVLHAIDGWTGVAVGWVVIILGGATVLPLLRSPDQRPDYAEGCIPKTDDLLDTEHGVDARITEATIYDATGQAYRLGPAVPALGEVA
jgi:hypothetical protein